MPCTFCSRARNLLLGAALLLGHAAVSQAAEGDDTVPSLAGKRIAVSMTGTSHNFDIKAFQAQVDEIKRLGGTPITLDAGRNDKNLVTQLQTVVTQKPDAVIQTLGTLSVIEVALNALEIPHGKGGAQAAIDWLGQQVKA